MAARPQDYRTLASLSRITLLHELQQHGQKTVDELAHVTGLHHNTAREHLHRLIEAGFVTSEPLPSPGKGRPKLIYSAAQGERGQHAQERAAAAHRRTAALPPLLPIRAVSNPRTAAARQLDLLDDHMAQCGFDADIDADGSRMTMHHCPFGELARAHPEVCAVHFELVKDALHLVNGPVQARALHPFSGPGDCTVDLVVDLVADLVVDLVVDLAVDHPAEPPAGETAVDHR